jgi:2-haloalkanoic acid dehalogenase type II
LHRWGPGKAGVAGCRYDVGGRPMERKMKHVLAICLDLDDTLWEIGGVIERAEALMHEWLARDYPKIVEAHDIHSMRRVRQRMAVEYPGMRHDFTFLRRQALAWHAREAGYPEQLADEAFEVFYAARNQVEVFADVVPALERLRARFRLMTLSNGNADLARIGLAQYFERTLAARDAGAAKPDRRIFEALLDDAGLQPGQVLYVGDDPQADVAGARAAGLYAAWVDRFGRSWPGDVEPPALTVRDLQELADRML